MARSIEDVVETLRNAQKRGKKCSVLIGAGCSVTAGIPTAQGFVEIIKQPGRYPRAFERATEKDYPHCMAELSKDEQRDLIAEYVDTAKLNWGHIALAQLMQTGYVDRVLTTNFDSLVIRACSLLGLFPAVYDFAASQNLEPDKIPEQAVFYLHGQRTGFVLINTKDAFEKHSKLLAPVFEDAGRGHVWLVVGYSGENDPVFDHLANVKCFDNDLYWIGYGDNEPAQHLRERLLTDGKDAFYVNGFDADSFFVTLAQMLETFPPDLVRRPFSYVEDIFDKLTPYTFSKASAPVDVMEYARKFVKNAIEEIEPIQTDVLEGWANLLSGEDQKVIALQEKYGSAMHPEVAEVLTWAYLFQGDSLAEDAKIKDGAAADELYKQAYEKYAAAVRIKPDKSEAFNNWGAALSEQAKTRDGAAADELYKQSYEKYALAVRIKPDYHKAFNNWGAALYEQAGTKVGAEADELFKDAEAVLLKAESILEGSSAYNLACIFAITGQEDECHKWLVISQKSGFLPGKKHLEQDSDLESVRNHDWFKEFMAQISS